MTGKDSNLDNWQMSQMSNGYAGLDYKIEKESVIGHGTWRERYPDQNGATQ